MTTDLKVSESTYNEIANALDAQGKKVVPGAILTIEKDTTIVNPLDWRLITLRRDVSDIAVKVYAEADEDGNQACENFVRFAAELYEFVKSGTVPELKGYRAAKPKPHIAPKRTEPITKPPTPAGKWGS